MARTDAPARLSEGAALDRFEHRFAAGHVVFEQGDASARMYIVRRGQVRIFWLASDEEVTLPLLGPGEFFGKMALLEGRPRCHRDRRGALC